MGSFAPQPQSTSYIPQETRETHRIVTSAINARQTDVASPTTADMLSPQTLEAGETRQPAQSSSRAFCNGHSATAESMDTGHGDLGVMVTTRPAPSPLPDLIDEQVRQSPETWIESLQRDELERTSSTPQGIQETYHTILSVNNVRQADAALPTITHMSSTQTLEAGATLQPAEPASHGFPSSHSTAIKSISTDTGNIRRRVTPPHAAFPQLSGSQVDLWAPLEYWLQATPREVSQTDSLRKLVSWTANSDFLRLQQPEPIIGDRLSNAPAAVEEQGIRGQSTYTCLFHHLDMETFTCKLCLHVVQENLEDAITHQRIHFHHYPYQCLPNNTNWYALLFLPVGQN